MNRFTKVGLHFWKNEDITNKCCRLIGTGLQRNASIEEFKLTLGLNKVNDEGFKRIFDGLLKKQSSKIKALHLNFRYTDINNDTKDILKEFFGSPAG
jgi:hypothetical protein